MPHLCHDLHCPEQESSGEQLTIPSSSTTTPMSRASVSLSVAFVRRAVIHWEWKYKYTAYKEERAVPHHD